MTAEKQEVLRYLGWKGTGLDTKMSLLIDSVMAECAELAAPRSAEMLLHCQADGNRILLKEVSLEISGELAQRMLGDCERVMLFAATLGQGIDTAIRRYSYADITRATILDAAATARIEAFCDQLEARYCRQLGAEGLAGGSRFSPGYGDLPLSLQPELLRILNAQRAMGVTCTPHLMMVPSKSVTAFIGYRAGQPEQLHSVKCDTCTSNATCQYRKIPPEKETR